MTPPETRYTTAGDSQVAYQVVGDGPIDLLYHHGMCHLDLQWDVEPEAAFNERLASFSRLILFDRRGSGASERGARSFLPSAEAWTEDVLAVLDAVGSTRAAVFAEGDAGPTAIRLAARYPDRVQALVLGNTWPRFREAPDYPAGTEDVVADALLEQIEGQWGTTDLVGDLFPLLRHDGETSRRLALLLRAAATPSMAAMLYAHAWTELDVRDELTAVTAPTLVLRNERSGAAADFMAEHIPGARLVDVDNDEVLFFGGDDAPVVAVVAEFLTGAPLRAERTRALATVVFTDIVGSTDRAAGMGDAAWREELALHDRCTRRHAEEHGGRVVKSTGDGALLTFDRPGQAIDATRNLVGDLATTGTDVRVGIHLGEIELVGDDVAGLAVHVAARISDLAEPGEVLVSRTVRDAVIGAAVEFVDRGSHELKGVPHRWEVLAVAPNGPAEPPQATVSDG